MSVYRKQPWQRPRIPDSVRETANTLRQSPALLTANCIADPYGAHLLSRRTQSVCFTGHRVLGQADETALAALDELLVHLYQNGYRDFLCGGALGFDLYVAEHIVTLRDRFPDVRLISCIPCAVQSAKWPRRDKSRYQRLLYLSDEVRVLSSFYYDGCMQVRNRYMVDRSSVCVAYMKRLRGGTFSTVCYAASQDLVVVNLAIPSAVQEYVQAFS